LEKMEGGGRYAAGPLALDRHLKKKVASTLRKWKTSESTLILIANSWGGGGPDLLRFLWAVADHAARNAHSLPLDRILTLSQPAFSEHDPPSEAQLLSFKILRGRLNYDYRLRLLTAVYEAVTERIFGRTHALVSHPEFLDFQAAARAVQNR
jgi:hypothetical protein